MNLLKTDKKRRTSFNHFSKSAPRKIVGLFLLLLLSVSLSSQVTIGSANKPLEGTILMLTDGTEDSNDVMVNAKRALGLPRVELKTLNPAIGKLAESINNTSSPAWDEDEHIGLVVYNVGARDESDICSRVIPAGLHVWTGSEWQGIGIDKDENITSSTDIYKGANSYIVKPGATIEIPVERAFKIWKDYANTVPGAATDNGKVLSPTYLDLFDSLIAHISWQEGESASITTGIISSATVSGSGESAVISLTAGSARGNALIQLQNHNQLTLWQWHIWVIDEDPTENLWVYGSTGTDPQCSRFMDRNLGAIIVGGENETNITNARPSHGLYYQWGRPTPMKTYGAYNPPNDAVSLNDSEQINLTTALTSHKFIIDSFNSLIYDWYESRAFDMWNSRWGDQSKNKDERKSAFDPCPEGWRVPSGKPNSPWQGTETWKSNTFWKANAGKHLEYTDTTITTDDPTKRVLQSWFPATGQRYINDGKLMQIGIQGNYWLASTNNSFRALNMYFTPNMLTPWGVDNRAAAQSVRCVQE